LNLVEDYSKIKMINPRDHRAAARVARQQQGAALVANVAALGPDDNKFQRDHLMHQRQQQLLRWLWPLLADWEIESMKKIILDYNRYAPNLQ
jgi:hypothetical protein